MESSDRLSYAEVIDGIEYAFFQSRRHDASRTYREHIGFAIYQYGSVDEITSIMTFVYLAKICVVNHVAVELVFDWYGKIRYAGMLERYSGDFTPDEYQKLLEDIRMIDSSRALNSKD